MLITLYYGILFNLYVHFELHFEHYNTLSTCLGDTYIYSKCRSYYSVVKTSLLTPKCHGWMIYWVLKYYWGLIVRTDTEKIDLTWEKSYRHQWNILCIRLRISEDWYKYIISNALLMYRDSCACIAFLMYSINAQIVLCHSIYLWR